MKTQKIIFTASLLSVGLWTGFAGATSITYTGLGSGPGPVPVSASAIFDISGNDLLITLTNTSPSNSGQDVPGSTLSGLFWNFTGNPTLTPFSATIPTGSSIIQAATCNPGPCAGVTNVAGEFGYQAAASFAGGPSGADRGIASSGYLTTGLAGNIGNFNNGAAGTNLDGPNSLDGINFGIISAAAGFNPNGGTESVPLIQNSVVFLLKGVTGLTIADISNVSFQYGTQFNELNVPGIPTDPDIPVPEPTAIWMLGLGLLGLGGYKRRQAKLAA